MVELDLIAPPKVIATRVLLEPAHNAVSSLQMLNLIHETSGFADWVYQTAAALPDHLRRENRMFFLTFFATDYLAGRSWSSFQVWVDHLVAQNPQDLLQVQRHNLSHWMEYELGDGAPSVDELLSNQEQYVSFVEQVFAKKEIQFERESLVLAFDLLNDPPAFQSRLVSHLRTMWEQYLEPEWKRNRPMLEESVAAFQTMDLGGMSTQERFRRITQREWPDEWKERLKGVEEMILVPSVHIGPYLILVNHGKTAVWVVFGARIPEGSAVRSPALSRSELLVRLSALADDTRLRVLELLAQEGELGAQDVMAKLGLSQSSASRHLQQLSASGYLNVRRREGAKYYSLNRERIDDTFHSLDKYL